MNRQTLFLVLVVTTVPLWFSTLHAEDSCEPVFAALTKMTSTPNTPTRSSRIPRCSVASQRARKPSTSAIRRL